MLRVLTRYIIGVGLLALEAGDRLIEKHQKSQIRRAFLNKQKLNQKPLRSTDFSPIKTPHFEWAIDNTLEANRREQLTVIHGKEKIGKSAYIVSQLNKNTSPGARYVDVRKIYDSLEDKSLVLPAALAEALNVNLRFVGNSLVSQIFPSKKSNHYCHFAYIS